MKNEKDVLIITFAATTAAMMMERSCRMDGMPGRMIPLPQEISAGCGLCWMTEQIDEAIWQKYMEEKGLRSERLVRMRW